LNSVRPATAADIPALSAIWYQGWTEAHRAHVPQALIRLRTPESFRIRLTRMLAQVITLGPVGAPLGFCAIKGDEIYQMYVAPAARGSDVAVRLLSAGESRLRDRGIKIARLDVIADNPRAIAFYTRCGWGNGKLQPVHLDTLGAPFTLTCLVLSKTL
jgi:ribosomal protein S18 acetylase RimI-like enzyme